MPDDFRSTEPEVFDIAALTQWEATHADFLDKTILILDYHMITTDKGEAYLASVYEVVGDKSFDNPPTQCLIGAIALMKGLEAAKEYLPVALTIGKKMPKSGEQAYYCPLPTPQKLTKVIAEYLRSKS